MTSRCRDRLGSGHPVRRPAPVGPTPDSISSGSVSGAGLTTAPSLDTGAAKATRAAKRNGWLAVLLAVALFGMWLYYSEYHPRRQAEALWREAQLLGRPANWEGAQGVHQGSDIATGTYRATVSKPDDDPVHSLWEWLGKLDVVAMPSDAERLGESCFSGRSCHYTFSHRDYRGWLVIYPSQLASNGVVYELRYEMWQPIVG